MRLCENARLRIDPDLKRNCANNATSARLGAQLLPGDASDSPETENKIRNHYKEKQPVATGAGQMHALPSAADTRDTEHSNHEAGESTITGCCAPLR
jgi:hypothetical protein